MKQILLFLATVCIASFSFGQKEHLRPETDHAQYGGLLKDYFEGVFRLLHQGYSEKPYARYTALPSFAGEYSFSIESKKDKQYILTNKIPQNYWYTEDKRKVQLISNQKVINLALYEKIGRLFQILAEQTQEPEKPTIGMKFQ
jgi:hypothetical protein